MARVDGWTHHEATDFETVWNGALGRQGASISSH